MPDFDKTKEKLRNKQAIAQGITLLTGQNKEVDGLFTALSDYATDASEDNSNALREIFPFQANDFDDSETNSLLSQFKSATDDNAKKQLIIGYMYARLLQELQSYNATKTQTNKDDAFLKPTRRGMLVQTYDQQLHQYLKGRSPSTQADLEKIFVKDLPGDLKEFITKRDERMKIKRAFVEIEVQGREPATSPYVKKLLEQAFKDKKYVDGKGLCLVDLRENYTPTGKSELRPVNLTVAYNTGFSQGEILDEMINRFDGETEIKVSGCTGENPYTHLRFDSSDKKEFAVCGQEIEGEIRYLKFDKVAYDAFASDPSMSRKSFQEIFKAFSQQDPSPLRQLTSKDYSSPLKAGPYQGCQTIRELIRKCPVMLAQAADRNVYESHPAPEKPTPPAPIDPALGLGLENDKGDGDEPDDTRVKVKLK